MSTINPLTTARAVGVFLFLFFRQVVSGPVIRRRPFSERGFYFLQLACYIVLTS